MTPTTIRALEEAITTSLRAIVPHELPGQLRNWQAVADVELIPGAKVRAFYVEIEDPIVKVGGAHGVDGVEHEGVLRIWTSYANLTRKELSARRGQDMNDIWVDLDMQRDPAIDGLVSVEPSGWSPEDDTEARAWGAHTYLLTFFGRGVNPP